MANKYAENVGSAAAPEPQGLGGEPWDPFGDGTKVYGCPECDATWNADDLHLAFCSRRHGGAA